MVIDKKIFLDELYNLKAVLVKKAQEENLKNIQTDEKEISLRNLAAGRSDAYEKSWLMVDNVIRKIIEA